MPDALVVSHAEYVKSARLARHSDWTIVNNMRRADVAEQTIEAAIHLANQNAVRVAKKKTYMRRYYKANRGWILLQKAEYQNQSEVRARRNALARERYARMTPEQRERTLAVQREKMREDLLVPAFRDERNARARERRAALRRAWMSSRHSELGRREK